MKQVLFCLLLSIVLISCSESNNNKTNQKELNEESSQAKVDSFFNDYFVFLDSVTDSLQPELQQERLRAYVMELEFLSGLNAHGKRTDKSYTGFTDIDPSDVQMWKDWYIENKQNFVWDTTYEGIKKVQNSTE